MQKKNKYITITVELRDDGIAGAAGREPTNFRKKKKITTKKRQPAVQFLAFTIYIALSANSIASNFRMGSSLVVQDTVVRLTQISIGNK